MNYIKAICVGLAALLGLGGCSFFVGSHNLVGMTAAQESAMYKKMTQETMKFAGNSVVILGAFLLMSEEVSDEDLKEKWVPAGIKAYMKKFFGAGGSGAEKGENEIVTAKYKAYISNSSFYKLGVPMVHAARFCAAANGTFVRTKVIEGYLPSKVDWMNKYHPPVGKWAGDGYGTVSDEDNIGWYNAIDGANKSAYWGEFECTQQDQKKWLVIITPDIVGGRMNATSCGAFDPKCEPDVARGFNITVKINVHTTPKPEKLLRLSDVKYILRPPYWWPMTERKYTAYETEQDGQKIIYYIWPTTKRNKLGCFHFARQITQGDWNVTYDPDEIECD